MNGNEKSPIENKQTEKATCKICGKGVAEKVKAYCLSNQERFNGNVFCIEHQK